MASACGSWYLLWWGWGEDTECVALGNRGEFGGGIILDQGKDKWDSKSRTLELKGSLGLSVPFSLICRKGS